MAKYTKGGLVNGSRIGKDWPFKGPYMYFDENSSKTGTYPTRDTPGTSTTNGVITNDGLAGSALDMTLQWRTNYNSGPPVTRTYELLINGSYFSTQQSWLENHFGGSWWDAGPTVFLVGLSDLDQPAHPANGFTSLGARARFEMYPQFGSGTFTFTHQHEWRCSQFEGTPGADFTPDIQTSFFAPQWNSGGTYLDDTVAAWDKNPVDVDIRDEGFPFSLWGSICNVMTGHGDMVICNKLYTEDEAGDLINPSNWTTGGSEQIYRGTPQGSAGHGYGSFMHGPSLFAELTYAFDAHPTDWHGVQALGVWRGYPTQEDLDTVRSEMGI